jgi:hypothetical protein
MLLCHARIACPREGGNQAAVRSVLNFLDSGLRRNDGPYCNVAWDMKAVTGTLSLNLSS